MPELPEVTALAAFLREHAGGQQVTSAVITSLNVLTTYDPPFSTLVGRTLDDATRHGKFLDLTFGDLHLVLHLARAGWLRWTDAPSAKPPRMGGPIHLRVVFTNGGFDITEAGTKKSVTAALVHDPQEVLGVARLGPDAMSLDRRSLETALAGQTGRLKNVIVDQKIIAGIGNAYSDEILHAARLSPFATAGKLTSDQLDALYEAVAEILTDAMVRSVGGEAARLKGEKRSGLRVHARTGLPCPVCGDTVAEVSFADRSFQYCPTCQTGGRKLADRRMSRLLR
ncbi:DNA-formamidopyrimidine glycosylase family protein [Nakamurella sp. A5-74]|uniref:DNA-formamidopyrimidine glycosylase family protein n=1 Tax=Nakamurella sp. A5-74 TaxID=3158264 RepID=A0AAU8DQP0_9ACTN